LSGRLHSELRYGENPHQKAQWYSNLGASQGLHEAKVLQGKALSYNNILDLDAATGLLRKMTTPSCVAVKHNNPCGVATSGDLKVAVRKALDADPVSVFGGVIAVNRRVEGHEAEMLTSLFLECVIAPDYSPEALGLFAKKPNLRILSWSALGQNHSLQSFEYKSISGGFLRQSTETPDDFSKSDWDYQGASPSQEILDDLSFAEKVCSSLKSNAIAIVSDGQTLGLGMGQVNRVDAVQQAVGRIQAHHAGKFQTLVLASDAFFPFKDSVEIAAKAGVQWIIQPGGSIKDEEVLRCAREKNIKMVLTGKRHFKH